MAKIVQDAKSASQGLTDADITRFIKTQNWPNLVIKFAGDGVGNGVYAMSDIPKGTIVCDYHGVLMNAEEGERQMGAIGSPTL